MAWNLSPALATWHCRQGRRFQRKQFVYNKCILTILLFSVCALKLCVCAFLQPALYSNSRCVVELVSNTDPPSQCGRKRWKEDDGNVCGEWARRRQRVCLSVLQWKREQVEVFHLSDSQGRWPIIQHSLSTLHSHRRISFMGYNHLLRDTKWNLRHLEHHFSSDLWYVSRQNCRILC